MFDKEIDLHSTSAICCRMRRSDDRHLPQCTTGPVSSHSNFESQNDMLNSLVSVVAVLRCSDSFKKKRKKSKLVFVFIRVLLSLKIQENRKIKSNKIKLPQKVTYRRIQSSIFGLWILVTILSCLPFFGFGLYYDTSQVGWKRCSR